MSNRFARVLFFVVLSISAASFAGAAERESTTISCRDAWGSLIRSQTYSYNYQSDTYQAWSNRTQRSSCQKEWVFLVFMTTGQDLLPYALADLYEMEAGFASGRYAASTLKSDVIVQLNQSSGWRRLHMFQVPQVYENKTWDEIQNWRLSQIQSPVIEQRSDVGTTKQKLKEFLTWAMRTYPAKNYAVMIWGHGQGYTEVFGSSGEKLSEERDFNGHNFSENVESSMSTRDLAQVFGEVRRGTGKNFELFVADACLMQQMEMAYEISPHFRFITGSPQIQNFFGLPYRRIFYEVNRGSFMGIKQRLYGTNPQDADEAYMIALMLPELLEASFNNGGGFRGLQSYLDPRGFYDLSMSSMSTSGLSEFVRTWTIFSRRLDAMTAQPDFLRAAQRVMDQIPVFAPGMKDIGLYVDSMKEVASQYKARNPNWNRQMDELIQSLDDVRIAIREMVIAKVIGPSWWDRERAAMSMLGASLWLPNAQQVSQYWDEYDRSHLFQTLRRNQSPWPDLLKRLSR